MFRSFDENEFQQELKNKDYDALKVDTVSAIRNDPTFVRGETEQVLNILRDKVPEIFEKEINLEYEERLERDKWDKKYFTKLTFWFQENFAESRLEYIKEVGRVVHKDTQRIYEASIRNSETNHTTSDRNMKKKVVSSNPIQAPAEKEHKFPVIGIIVVAAVLVLIMVLLFTIPKQ